MRKPLSSSAELGRSTSLYWIPRCFLDFKWEEHLKSDFFFKKCDELFGFSSPVLK